MSKAFSIKQLAGCIRWWLNYHSSIGRKSLLDEGAIKYPFIEYLERSDVKNITLELPHPKLSKKRIDLHFQDNKTNTNIAFEFKFIKHESTKDIDEKQRIFDDLMRLYLMSSVDQKVYFLICGEQAEFIASFQRIESYTGTIRVRKSNTLPSSSSSSGFYTEWFSFDLQNPIKTINIETQSAIEYKSVYDDFLKDYNNSYNKKTSQTLNLPSTIQTKLVYLAENSSDDDRVYDPARIGIWEIF